MLEINMEIQYCNKQVHPNLINILILKINCQTNNYNNICNFNNIYNKKSNQKNKNHKKLIKCSFKIN